MSPKSLFYGFGASSVKHLTEVSDLFSGTGDLLNPIVMTDQLESAYYQCLKRVEINQPVKFSSVIKKAVEFAEQSQSYFLNGQENSEGIGNDSLPALSYFVQYVFCMGFIDDVQETINQMTKVVSLPLSIYIIQLNYNNNIKEGDVDGRFLEQKCKFLFEKGNRRFLRVIQYNDLFNQGAQNAMEKLT